jgi:hypothetical protein
LHCVAIERKAMSFAVLYPCGCHVFDIRGELSEINLPEEFVIVMIPTATYNGHALRTYAHQHLPPFDDPYATGPGIGFGVRIDTTPINEADAECYSTVFDARIPATSDAALDLAMQFGKDIIEGKVHATAP